MRNLFFDSNSLIDYATGSVRVAVGAWAIYHYAPILVKHDVDAGIQVAVGLFVLSTACFAARGCVFAGRAAYRDYLNFNLLFNSSVNDVEANIRRLQELDAFRL